MLKYFLDRYKTEEICDKATDAFLSTLKFVPVCFVINGNVWKARCCFLYWWYSLFNEGSDNTTIFSHDMGLIIIYLNNIKLDDDNFDDDNPQTIIHVRLMVWCNRFK